MVVDVGSKECLVGDLLTKKVYVRQLKQMTSEVKERMRKVTFQLKQRMQGRHPLH